MKDLKESIFDEKALLKNLDDNAVLNTIKKISSSSKFAKGLKDQTARDIMIGDIVLFSNDGLIVRVGLVTDIDKEAEMVLINHTGNPNTGWWIDPDKILLINKKILNEIAKII